MAKIDPTGKLIEVKVDDALDSLHARELADRLIDLASMIDRGETAAAGDDDARWGPGDPPNESED